jgi:hypothetical protein
MRRLGLRQQQIRLGREFVARFQEFLFQLA